MQARQTAVVVCAVVALAGCSSRPARQEAPAQLPKLTMENFRPATREQVEKTYAEALAKPQDATANGTLGMVLDAYEQHDAAQICYRLARALEPQSFRWVYYLAVAQAAVGGGGEPLRVHRQSVHLPGGVRGDADRQQWPLLHARAVLRRLDRPVPDARPDPVARSAGGEPVPVWAGESGAVRGSDGAAAYHCRPRRLAAGPGVRGPGPGRQPEAGAYPVPTRGVLQMDPLLSRRSRYWSCRSQNVRRDMVCCVIDMVCPPVTCYTVSNAYGHST